jgi:hypothetical protein
MNERIKQLADQATSYMPGRPPYDGLTFDMFDKEKFAELIVEECITALRTDECNYSDLAVEEFTRNRKRIRKHFGVEE